MTWIKISEEDGGIYALAGTPDPQSLVSIDELNLRIVEADEQIAVWNEAPDMIEVPNIDKQYHIMDLNAIKLQTTRLIGELVG